MTEIEKSEVVIAKILTLLMEWGIQECDLRFEELELDPKEYGSFFFSCVHWLENEGLIRTSRIDCFMDAAHAGVVNRPVLTSYGFYILGTKVKIGDHEATLSETVKEVSSSAGNYSNIGDFFGGLLGGFTKSVGS